MTRLGVVGTKGVGRTHLGCIRELQDCELAAVCDVNEDEARACGREHGVPFYADVGEMLSSERLDGVTVCTPHWFHPGIACAAFDAGVHVLTEKPMAVTLEDAERMVDTARAKGLLLGVVFQHRTDALQIRAREIVASGELGELHRLLLVAAWFRPEAYYRSDEWRGTWKGEGGGVLLNQAPHSLDSFIWISALMPDRVYGRTDTFMHRIEVEDRASALLHYPNGATGYVQASTSEYPGLSRMEFAGERGRMVLEDGSLRLGLLDRPLREFSETAEDQGARPQVTWSSRERPEGAEGSEAGALRARAGHCQVIADFAESIRTGRSPMVPGEEGMKSLELAAAVVLSSHRNSEVPVPVPRKAYTELVALLAERAPRRRKRRTTSVRRR
jgi:predicted dehydrogenase